MLATCLHFLQGTPYVYQGEELGMRNVRFETMADYRDIETLNRYRVAVQERGQDPAQVMAAIHAKSRDNARTPMPWNAGPNAGFTSGRPWIALNPDYGQINAEQALVDPDSVFHYYRRLIALRKQLPVMVQGRYDLLLPEHPEIYAYTRSLDHQHLLVVCNFSAQTPRFALPPQFEANRAELLIANYPVDADDNLRALSLRPYEARAYLLH
jgi:oligo-1,6-glucosidase